MLSFQDLLYRNRKLVIWGAGDEGIRILCDLIRQDVYVDCFCDSDEAKQKIRVWNKNVISPKELFKRINQCNIIISPKDQNCIDEILADLQKVECGSVILGKDIPCSIPDDNLSAPRIWKLIQDSRTRKHIIWGCNYETELILQASRMLDISIKFIVETNAQDEKFYGTEVRDVYDLAYEDPEKIMVLLTRQEDIEENYRILNELGLEEKKNYDRWELYTTGNYITYALDPNLGYTYVNGNFEICPGVTLFGSWGAKIRIVILGGSTSDATRFYFKSWGEILYELLKKGGYDICVMSAACSGYNSSQELVKLIRDIVPLQPNIVISYSGVNDSWDYLGGNELELYPFINPYQQDMTILEAEKIKYRKITSSKETYSLGLKGVTSRFDRFKKNIHMMKAICESYGISYFSILQPYIGTIRQYTSDEMELIINTRLRPAIKASRTFYEQAISEPDKEYKDLTGIFESLSGIYIDQCHVTEKGNRIIATHIYSLIKETLNCIF